MTLYIIRRLLASILVLVSVLVLVFMATHAIGDPANSLLPLNAPPEQREALRNSLGLNDPILVQLGRFLGDALRGDFGVSIWQGGSALELAWSRVPATLSLAAVTLALTVPIAVGLGVVAAAFEGTIWDRSIGATSLVAIATIDFAFALVLILVFAVSLQWLPTSGYGGAEYFVLPVITLAIRPMGRIIQVTRASVGDELHRAYMMTAKAKGLSKRRRISIHALRNGSIPIVSLIGVEAIGLVNGAIIVETIFGWPGIGYLLIQAIQNRDLPLIHATVFVTGVLVVSVGVITDLAYAWLDPKIRH